MSAFDHINDAAFLNRGDETENAFSGFLREFELKQVPERAEIALTADTHYKLYVNGRCVGYGPAPFRRPVMRVDSYDLHDFLIAGLNSVFVLTRFIGIDCKYNVKGEPGFIGAIKMDGEVILSDDQWSAFRLDAWEHETPKITWALPPMECVNLSSASYGILTRYACEDFAAKSDVEQDCKVPIRTHSPAGITFQKRGVPNLHWEAPCALRLKEVFRTVNEVYNLKDSPLRLDREGLKPAWDIEACDIFGNPQPSLPRKRGEPGYALLYDTLRMTAGDFTVEIESSGPATVDIGSAEQLISGRPFISRNGSYYVTRLHLVPGVNRFRLYAFTGFRYLYLVARDFEGILKIRKLAYNECYSALDYRDSCDLGDRAFAAIYEISRRSIQLTTQAAYHDCNTREHGNYWGDAIWVADMLGHMSGDFSHMREQCLAMPGEYEALGTLNSSLYGKGRPLIDYCMIAVEMLRRYVRYTADFETARKALPTCRAIVGDFSSARDDAGFVRLENLKALKPEPYENAIIFLDHPGLGWHGRTTTGIERAEPSAGLNLYFLQALQAIRELSLWLGESDTLDDPIEHLRGLIRTRFYCPNTGLIADSLDGSGKPSGYSQIVNALAVMSGVLEGDAACRAMRMVCDLEQHPWVAQGTPYTYFSIFEALGRLGLEELALRELRTRWLPMIEQGATTTWETFRCDNHDSLNHAWSAPLPYFVRRWLAGIEPLAPGYSRVRIAPSLHARERASITMVLPQGPVGIGWLTQPDSVVGVHVEIPKGVEAILVTGAGEQPLKSGLNELQVTLKS